MKVNRLSMNLRHTYCFKGQSLGEYGLVIGLIAVVSIGGLIILGVNINHSLAKVSDLTVFKAKEAATKKQLSGRQTNNTNLSLTSDPYQTYAGLNTLPLKSFMNNNYHQTDVSGANGHTADLIISLDTTIKEAIDSGQVPEENINVLWALSEQGHKIGDLVGGDVSETGSTILSEVSTFQIMLNDLKNNGVLNDLALDNKITNIVDEICSVSAEHIVASEKLDSTSAQTSTSETIHNYSTKICDAGDVSGTSDCTYQ